MTKEEIISAANQLPLVERKALLQELVVSMWKDIEVTNRPDKLEVRSRLQAIAREHGFSALIPES